MLYNRGESLQHAFCNFLMLDRCSWEIPTKTVIIPARDPRQCGGANGYQTSGGHDDDDDDDDDDNDTQMRGHRSRHMRAHDESRHIRANRWEHTYESKMRAHI